MDPKAPPLHIYWHHLGREHGLDGYAGELRKNDPETIARYLAARENPGPPCAGAHRLIRHDENTLVELSPERSEAPFLIVYFIDKGLQYSIGYKKRPGWLIDIVEIEETKPNTFAVRDLFLDIQVEPDGSYKVIDEDEYQQALRLGIMSERQVMRSVRSLKMALDELSSGSFPSERLKSLVERYFSAPA